METVQLKMCFLKMWIGQDKKSFILVFYKVEGVIHPEAGVSISNKLTTCH